MSLTKHRDYNQELTLLKEGNTEMLGKFSTGIELVAEVMENLDQVNEGFSYKNSLSKTHILPKIYLLLSSIG